MTRLPIPDGDSGEWGEILNEFLSVQHDTDGTHDIPTLLNTPSLNGYIPISDTSDVRGFSWQPSSVLSNPALGGDLTGTISNAQIAAGAVGGTEIAAGAIDDSHIGGSAAIAQSKIAGLSSSLADKANTAITITGTTSITGGGSLAANRTLSLVNDATSPGNNYYYGTNGSGTKGYFSMPSGGANSLNDLTDIVLTTPANGEVLKYNGTNWVNSTDATGGGAGNGFTTITDGSTNAVADSTTDTFRLRSADNKLSIAVASDDPTYGDSALFTVNEANLNPANFGTNPLARANHTGTQTTATISNFQEAVEDIIGTKVVAGTNVTVSYNDATGDTTISAAAGSGEANTASNVGVGGVGVFKQKTGTNLEFKNINAASSKVTVVNESGTNEIDIDVTESALTLNNIGGTLSVTKGGTGATSIVGAINGLLPSQTGNSGEFLTTDGSNIAWAAITNENGFSTITDGTNNAVADSPTDTFKLRSADNKLSVTVANDDATHGDSALFTVNEANLTLANLSGNLPESRITNLSSDLASKVNDTGDTMTGALSIEPATFSDNANHTGLYAETIYTPPAGSANQAKAIVGRVQVGGTGAMSSTNGQVAIEALAESTVGTGSSISHIAGFATVASHYGDGTVDHLMGLRISSDNISGGTVNNYRAIMIEAPNVAGATTTNSTAIHIDNFASGTNNYAIYSNSGRVRFGDILDMSTNRVINLGAPTSATDAASKSYVDARAERPSFFFPGNATVQSNGYRIYNDSGVTWTIMSVRASSGTAPTGANLVVDVNMNGTTIFTNQANRPTIIPGVNTSGKITNMDVTAIADGTYLSVDIDQIGSGTPGANVSVVITIA